MNFRLKLPLASLALTLAASAALAQSRSTQVAIGVSNEDFATESVIRIEPLFNQDSSAAFTSGDVDTTFSGLNRSGDDATMRFVANGFGRSNFGRLGTFTSVTVTDAFYNSENAPYVNTQTGETNTDGTPDFLDAFAAARFTDPLQYGGALQSGYGARYIFNLSGAVTGNAEGQASYQVQFGSNEPENVFFNFNGNAGNVQRTYATKVYPISGSTPENIFVAFGTSTTARTQLFEDGDTIFGTGEFSSTLVLTGIEIVDANGNPISGVTVTSGSGTVYPILNPVPEPASLAVLALGGIGLIARRRKRS